MGPGGLRLDEHESSVVSRMLTWSMVCTAVSARAWNLESRIACCLLGQSHVTAPITHFTGFQPGKQKPPDPAGPTATSFGQPDWFYAQSAFFLMNAGTLRSSLRESAAAPRESTVPIRSCWEA